MPLADLIEVGFGRAGRDATAVLAVALTMGTMNVYMGGSARLAAALAREGALPGWLGGDAQRSVPRRPLVVLGLLGSVLLVALAGRLRVAAAVALALVTVVAVFSSVFLLVPLAAAVLSLGFGRRRRVTRRLATVPDG